MSTLRVERPPIRPDFVCSWCGNGGPMTWQWDEVEDGKKFRVLGCCDACKDELSALRDARRSREDLRLEAERFHLRSLLDVADGFIDWEAV